MSESSAGDAMATAAAVAVGWRRAGIAGAAIGVIAAGAAAGVAVERMTVGRGMRRRARLALDASGPYGVAARHARPGHRRRRHRAVLRDRRGRTGRWYGRGHPTGGGCRGRRYRTAAAPALRPQGPRARHRRLQPRLLPQPGLLALPAGGAARPGAHRPLGPAQPRPLRARPGPGRGRDGRHRPARPRPEGGHRRGRPRGPAAAGRALDGRHDDHGARRSVPAADPGPGRRASRSSARRAGSSARSTSGCRSRA